MTQPRLNIQPDNLTVALLTPPIAQTKSDLTEFYSAVSKNYDYGSFILLNPGAVLTSQNGGTIQVSPNSIQVIEPIADVFKISQEKVTGIIKELYFKKFYEERMPQKFIGGYVIKLVCKYKIGDAMNSASDFVSKKIELGPDRLKLLGAVDKLSPGLRFNFLLNGGQYDLRIEPWLVDADRKTLWLELVAQFPGGPLSTVLSLLEEKIENVRSYLIKDIKDFIEHWGQS